MTDSVNNLGFKTLENRHANVMREITLLACLIRVTTLSYRLLNIELLVGEMSASLLLYCGIFSVANTVSFK